MISPEALQTKTSIWPGVSTSTCRICFFCGVVSGGGGAVRFSSMSTIWSILVVNRLSDVRMPPLGPRLYCDMTSL